MFRYLHAAFFVRPSIPGLGRVPINLLGVVCFGILGLGNAGFWFLGVALETAFLTSLASNYRFQKTVDGEELQMRGRATLDKRKSLVELLDPPARQRLASLQAKAARAIDISRKQGLDAYVIDSSRDALDRLSWLHLRLLLARHFLLSDESQSTAANIREQIDALQKELESDKLSFTIRESKTATRDILLKRLDNFDRKEQSLQAIDSDLMRIEAQVELAVQNATMSNEPRAISSNISLASHLLDPVLFGSSEQAVADLDMTYGQTDSAESTPQKESA